jgi:hypothetical protein
MHECAAKQFCARERSPTCSQLPQQQHQGNLRVIDGDGGHTSSKWYLLVEQKF